MASLLIKTNNRTETWGISIEFEKRRVLVYGSEGLFKVDFSDSNASKKKGYSKTCPSSFCDIPKAYPPTYLPLPDHLATTSQV